LNGKNVSDCHYTPWLKFLHLLFFHYPNWITCVLWSRNLEFTDFFSSLNIFSTFIFWLQHSSIEKKEHGSWQIAINVSRLSFPLQFIRCYFFHSATPPPTNQLAFFCKEPFTLYPALTVKRIVAFLLVENSEKNIEFRVSFFFF